MSRALILERFGSLPALRERPVPDRKPGETLLRVRASQIGHLDLDVVEGTFGLLPDLPSVPGTEACGEVVASDTYEPGALVRVRGGGVGLRRDGGWADHLVAPDNAVVAVPAGTDPAIACSFFSPAATAWAAVHAVADLQPGERVIVTGAAGAVGAMTVQVAARAGAEVIGVVGRPAKLAYVPDGAQAVLATDLTTDAVGGPADALIDTVGGPVLTSALRLVRPRGRAALVGYTAGREFAVDLAHFLLADVSVLPVNLLSRSRELIDVGDRLLAEITAGTLHLPVERFGLAGLATAVDRLRGGQTVGKAVFELS